MQTVKIFSVYLYIFQRFVTVEDSSRLGCDATSLSGWLPTFRSNKFFNYQISSSPRRIENMKESVVICRFGCNG